MPAAWQATITDESGTIQPLASVEVLLESNGASAALFSDRAGTAGISNPVTADANGFVRFYTAGGAHRITATLGAFSREWRHVAIGLLGESDELDSSAIRYEITPAEIAAAVTPTNNDSAPGVFTRYNGTVASSASTNTGALQDALDSNQTVEIHESGVHNLNDTILMNDDNLIVGKGTACVLMWNVTSRSLIEGVTKSSARQFRWGIRDVTIDNTSRSNASAIAIDLSNLSDGTIFNVHVRNVATAYYGVSAHGSLQNALFRCQALNVVTAMTLGTLTNEWKVYDIRVTDATDGVVINDNSGHKFYGLQVETFTGTGVTIGNTATAQSVLIDGVRLENLSAGSSIGFNLHATQAVNTVITGLQPVNVNTLFSSVGTDTIVLTGDRNSPELRCNQLALGQGGIDNLSYAMIKATAAADASVRNSSDSGYADWRASDLYAARYLRLAGAALGAASTVTFGNATQTTVGAAGAASALPATPSGYLRFFVGTAEFVIPYYLQA